MPLDHKLNTKKAWRPTKSQLKELSRLRREKYNQQTNDPNRIDVENMTIENDEIVRKFKERMKKHL